MALPSIMRKLFRNDGYGPLLKPEIIPFASDLASNGAEAATTEWVKDLSVAPVYLDPNGSDSSDGLTSGTAVKTFERALEVRASLPSHAAKFIVAAGTYNSDLIVGNDNLQVVFLGDTTINGQICSVDNSCVLLTYEGSEPTITISYTSINADTHKSAFYAHGNSYLYCVMPISISGGTSASPLQCQIGVYLNSIIVIEKNVSISGYSSYAIFTSIFSCIKLNSVTSSGLSTNRFMVADDKSLLYFTGDVTGASSAAVCSLAKNSAIYIEGTATLTTTGSDYYSIYVSDNSYFYCNILVLNRNHSSAGGVPFVVACVSYAIIQSLTVNASKDVVTFIEVNQKSELAVQTYLKMSGNATSACTIVDLSGIMLVRNTATVVNNATGARYRLNRRAMIQTAGAGANRLPGNANGIVDSTSNYF